MERADERVTVEIGEIRRGHTKKRSADTGIESRQTLLGNDFSDTIPSGSVLGRILLLYVRRPTLNLNLKTGLDSVYRISAPSNIAAKSGDLQI